MLMVERYGRALLSAPKVVLNGYDHVSGSRRLIPLKAYWMLTAKGESDGIKTEGG